MNDGMGDGLHLVFEGRGKTVNEATVTQYLKACPDVIGMTPISEPQVLLGAEGWCGFVVIAQSHISIHCRGTYVLGDVFSCAPFEIGPAIDLAESTFGLTGIKTEELSRGWVKAKVAPGTA